MKKPSNPKGFTLIEILMTLAIFSVIMGAVYSLFITNQRAAYTQDEVSDIQMNLRIAMDSVVRDLRMAGMLVDYQPVDALLPVLPIQGPVVNNTGPSSPIPDPVTGAANPGSDAITLNMASAIGAYGMINVDNGANGTAVSSDFTLRPSLGASQVSDVEQFQPNDLVRIIRPRSNNQPAGAATTFTVTATNPGANTISLGARGVVEFQKSDMIARVNAYRNPVVTAGPTPNTVQYAVISNAASPSTVTTHPDCPVGQFCLARRMNGELDPAAGNGPRWEIVAQNIRNFQLSYVTSDNPADVSDAPADLSTVTAIKVTITGQTATTRALSGNVIKVRQLESFVKLINRRQ